MNSVNIRQARRRLSEIVDAAERGESVIITRRGRNVACVSPVKPVARRRLPDLSEFRKSLKVKGRALSATVSEARKSARY
jgi:prevent-host-death family protein